MRLTAYIPCFNGEGYLEPTIRALLAQTRSPDRILVIDDGSTDQTATIAKRQGVRVVSHAHNQGIAAARNTAWRETDGDILLGLDVDAIPDPDYVERVTAVFEGEPNLAAVCGRLIEANCERPPDHWRQVHMAQHYGDKIVTNPRICFGSVTALRRSAIEAVGGWDERFRSNHEDVDMTDRLRRAELTARYEPSCIARHQRTDTVASVLSGFWNWFAARGHEKGHFQSWDRLINSRIKEVTWGIFNHRFAQDLEHDRTDLLAITFLLPWWMAIHDLAELAGPDAVTNRDATVRERANAECGMRNADLRRSIRTATVGDRPSGDATERERARTAEILINSVRTSVEAAGGSPYVIERMTRFLQGHLCALFPDQAPPPIPDPQSPVPNPQSPITNHRTDMPSDEFIATFNNAAADALSRDPKIWARIDSSMRLLEL